MEPLRFVQSKVMEDKSFCPFRRLSGASTRQLWLLNIVATIGSRRNDWPEMAFPELKIENVSRAQAVAGTSQPTNHAILGIRLTGVAKRCRSSAADGRRGCKECNCVSSVFISFISDSFQLEFYFLQTVTIPARGGIR